MISKKEDQKEAKQKNYKRYTVDFNAPVENNLLTLESALKYMQSNMKINGLKGKLGNTIKINLTDKKDKNKNSLVFSVDTTIQFSKRYIRYLVKKFLKREGIARFLTVSSTAPNAYTVKVIKKNEA
jgi:large subunit ribosomal protein L22e